MPFLKGIEILPADESTKAIEDSEAAAVKTDSTINAAKGFLKAKLQEAAKYVKELSVSVTEELTAHQSRLEVVVKKLDMFKKETSERRMAALLAEVVEAVSETEKKVVVLKGVAEVLSTEDLESVSVDTLKDGGRSVTPHLSLPPHHPVVTQSQPRQTAPETMRSAHPKHPNPSGMPSRPCCFGVPARPRLWLPA